MDAVPTRDARERVEMNAFFIQPLKRETIGRLFSTHPSTEARIEKLQDSSAHSDPGNRPRHAYSPRAPLAFVGERGASGRDNGLLRCPFITNQ